MMLLLFFVTAVEAITTGSVYLQSGKFNFVLNKFDSNAVAWCSFDDTTTTNGWGQLHVETNGAFTNPQQARAAGICEGALTTKGIDYTWTNNAFPMKFDAKVNAFIVRNFLWMDKQIKANPNDEYWQQVEVTSEQIQGLNDGYHLYGNNSQMNAFQMWLMSSGSDVGDVETGVGGKQRAAVERDDKCSAVVRLDRLNNELYTGQTTWSEFWQMVRILKTYDFKLKLPNGKPVKGERIKFSGYPGSIYSGDDFYTIGDSLSVVETTCGVDNATLWQNLTPESVMTYARAMVANRLAKSAVDWVDLFARFNSGTYNNQWIAVDYSKFRSRKSTGIEKGTVMMIETLPGFVKSGDISDYVDKNGYYGSFNVWYFTETFDLAGEPALVKKYGGWFGYHTTARYLMFQRDAPMTSSIQEVGELMRYNAFRTDPLSVNPVRSAENAISARSDLNPINASYPFDALGPRCHGGIDSKITSNKYIQMNNGTFMAVAGPTYGGADNLPPFDWSSLASNHPCYGKPHEGIPNLMQFDWIDYN